MVVEKLDRIPDYKCVKDRPEADAFPHQKVDADDDDRNQCYGHTVVERRVIGHTHAQAVPRSQADVGEDGKVHTEREDHQADEDPKPLLQDGFLAAVHRITSRGKVQRLYHSGHAVGKSGNGNPICSFIQICHLARFHLIAQSHLDLTPGTRRQTEGKRLPGTRQRPIPPVRLIP